MSVFFYRGKIWLHILVQLLRNLHIGGQLVTIARFHKKSLQVTVLLLLN